MTANVRHLPLSVLYAGALSWLLLYENTAYRGYSAPRAGLRARAASDWAAPNASGHAVVAAGSFVTVYFIVTTTDLSTAILTHGLLLLLVVLGLFPRPARRPMESYSASA